MVVPGKQFGAAGELFTVLVLLPHEKYRSVESGNKPDDRAESHQKRKSLEPIVNPPTDKTEQSRNSDDRQSDGKRVLPWRLKPF